MDKIRLQVKVKRVTPPNAKWFSQFIDSSHRFKYVDVPVKRNEFLDPSSTLHEKVNDEPAERERKVAEWLQMEEWPEQVTQKTVALPEEPAADEEIRHGKPRSLEVINGKWVRTRVGGTLLTFKPPVFRMTKIPDAVLQKVVAPPRNQSLSSEYNHAYVGGAKHVQQKEQLKGPRRASEETDRPVLNEPLHVAEPQPRVKPNAAKRPRKRKTAPERNPKGVAQTKRHVRYVAPALNRMPPKRQQKESARADNRKTGKRVKNRVESADIDTKNDKVTETLNNNQASETNKNCQEIIKKLEAVELDRKRKAVLRNINQKAEFAQKQEAEKLAKKRTAEELAEREAKISRTEEVTTSNKKESKWRDCPVLFGVSDEENTHVDLSPENVDHNDGKGSDLEKCSDPPEKRVFPNADEQVQEALAESIEEITHAAEPMWNGKEVEIENGITCQNQSFLSPVSSDEDCWRIKNINNNDDNNNNNPDEDDFALDLFADASEFDIPTETSSKGKVRYRKLF